MRLIRTALLLTAAMLSALPALAQDQKLLLQVPANTHNEAISLNFNLDGSWGVITFSNAPLDGSTRDIMLQRLRFKPSADKFKRKGAPTALTGNAAAPSDLGVSFHYSRPNTLFNPNTNRFKTYIDTYEPSVTINSDLYMFDFNRKGVFGQKVRLTEPKEGVFYVTPTFGYAPTKTPRFFGVSTVWVGRSDLIGDIGLNGIDVRNMMLRGNHQVWQGYVNSVQRAPFGTNVVGVGEDEAVVVSNFHDRDTGFNFAWGGKLSLTLEAKYEFNWRFKPEDDSIKYEDLIANQATHLADGVCGVTLKARYMGDKIFVGQVFGLHDAGIDILGEFELPSGTINADIFSGFDNVRWRAEAPHPAPTAGEVLGYVVAYVQKKGRFFIWGFDGDGKVITKSKSDKIGKSVFGFDAKFTNDRVVIAYIDGLKPANKVRVYVHDLR